MRREGFDGPSKSGLEQELNAALVEESKLVAQLAAAQMAHLWATVTDVQEKLTQVRLVIAGLRQRINSR